MLNTIFTDLQFHILVDEHRIPRSEPVNDDKEVLSVFTKQGMILLMTYV